MARFTEDKLELFITGFLILSLAFLAINFNPQIATILIIFIVFSIFIFFVLPARITHNSNPKNTLTSLGWGIGGVVAIILIGFFLTTAFQGFLNVTAEPTLASIRNSGFSSLGVEEVIVTDRIGNFAVGAKSQPIFSQSAILTIFTFGILIAAVETRMLGRAMEWLSVIFKVNLDGSPIKIFGIAILPNIKVLAIFFLLSGLFVWYHADAKGVTNNVALMLTFVFAFISLEIIRRTKELEAATYLHMFNNLLYIIPAVQGRLIQAQAIGG